MPKHTHPKPNDANRCTWTSVSGNRCRMLLAPGHGLLCVHHLQQQRREEGDLVGQGGMYVTRQLENKVAVRRAMRRLARALVQNRIDPPRAVALLRLCGLLIRTARRSRSRAVQRPAGLRR